MSGKPLPEALRDLVDALDSVGQEGWVPAIDGALNAARTSLEAVSIEDREPERHNDFIERDGKKYTLCPHCEELCGCESMAEGCGHCPSEKPEPDFRVCNDCGFANGHHAGECLKCESSDLIDAFKAPPPGEKQEPDWWICTTCCRLALHALAAGDSTCAECGRQLVPVCRSTEEE